MKKSHLILIIFLVTGLLAGGFIIINSFFLKRITSKERIYECINKYIAEVDKTEEYKSAFRDLQNTAFYDSTDDFVIYKSIERYKIDSMILFNRTRDTCCGFVLQICTKQDAEVSTEHVFNFNGILKNDKWYFEEGFSTSFRSKELLTFSYLSKSIRLDMALDGFIKNNDCEVDWDYVRKWFVD